MGVEATGVCFVRKGERVSSGVYNPKDHDCDAYELRRCAFCREPVCERCWDYVTNRHCDECFAKLERIKRKPR